MAISFFLPYLGYNYLQMSDEKNTSSDFAKEISCCRLCGSSSLTSVFDLGEQYIAGAFFREEVPAVHQRRYPLELVRCDKAEDLDACGLVQLRHTLPRNILFGTYGYRSGINKTMTDNLREIADRAETIVDLRGEDTVLDIGCNDGTLLASYSVAGLDKIGMDPADDVTRYAVEQGFEVVSDFFSAKGFHTARPNRKARVITSIAMFYDLDDPLSFTRDIASILSPDGVWVLEHTCLTQLISATAFDSICHEHLTYFSLHQFEWMIEQAGLVLHDLEENSMNGGSLRLFVRPKTADPATKEQNQRLELIREKERKLKLNECGVYDEFRDRCEKTRVALRKLVLDLIEEGKTIYIYGASTKGNVILQYCEFDVQTFAAAADRNPDKHGAITLGSKIPIISEEEARQVRPDFFLILPYHFLEEFLEREKDFLQAGGKFIVPLPEVKIFDSVGSN